MVSTSQQVAPNAASNAGQGDDYVPFAVRFRAWWDGVEPGAMVRQGQSASVRRNRLIVVDAPTAESGSSEEWADLRYRLWSRLYGEGFSLPGGQEVTTQFLKYIDLQKTHTVLDLAAGLGGTIRAAALQFGATVMGLEPDADVAELGMKISLIRGLEARVPISNYDPETISLADQAYDVVIIRERLAQTTGRERLLAQAEKALASNGRIVVTDLMLSRTDLRSSTQMQAMADDTEVEPWTLGEFQEECGRCGLQIALFRDETDGYRRLLLDSWTDFSNNITKETLDRPFVDALMREAEVMKRRITAINSGCLRYGYMELSRTSSKS